MASLVNRFMNHIETAWGITFLRVKTSMLLDRQYHVVKGTLRSRVDYDDAWLVALAGEARIVFDIGCNIGQSTLLLLHPGRVEKIVLVDPNALALSLAARNLILNGLEQRARFICAFASDQPDGAITFYTIGSGAAGSMYASHAKTASGMGLKRRVPTTTLDRLMETTDCIPDLVKIDVEGAERLVLKGAAELARRRETRFFVEMHSSAELPMRENAGSILDWCQGAGYVAWYLKEMCPLTTAETIAGRGRCHLLLLPEGESPPDGLTGLEQGASLEKVRRILEP